MEIHILFSPKNLIFFYIQGRNLTEFSFYEERETTMYDVFLIVPKIQVLSVPLLIRGNIKICTF